MEIRRDLQWTCTGFCICTRRMAHEPRCLMKRRGPHVETGRKYWRDIHRTVCHGLFGFWKRLNFACVKLIFIHWMRNATLVIKMRSHFQFYWEEEWIIEISLLVVGLSLLLCLLLNKVKQTHLMLLPLLPTGWHWHGSQLCADFPHHNPEKYSHRSFYS